MERLTWSIENQKMLEEIAENNQCYWRYQGAHHNGLIPVGHESHERVFEGEAPEYVEEGCSCYDNPYQLFSYMLDHETFINKLEVVLFVGKHMGYGLDEEDIVMVTEESDILYSMSAEDFFTFCKNCDLYFFGDKNLKEYAERNL